MSANPTPERDETLLERADTLARWHDRTESKRDGTTIRDLLAALTRESSARREAEQEILNVEKVLGETSAEANRRFDAYEARIASAEQRAAQAETIEEQIARLAHRGQVDKAGNPYIQHVERVVARVSGAADAEAVAWLHDVLEDSPFTKDVLCRFVDTVDVIEAVELLTRTPPYEYGQYIERIAASGHLLAIMVKLADLRDHLDNPGCPASLRPRYEKALATLMSERP